MKTWHWIVIGGMVLIVGFIFVRRRMNSAAPIVAGDKVGTGTSDQGAPPLPNVAMSNPITAKLFTFARTNSFGRRSL